MAVAHFLDNAPFDNRSPVDVDFAIAESELQLAGFWRLRRKIFCEEQRLFVGSDLDVHDQHMIPIVCQTRLMGALDEVVGCVRIYEEGDDVWWGGRLGVANAYRHLVTASPAMERRAELPKSYASHSLGGGLIYAAVTTALERGCSAFYAHVQLPNLTLFERLGWNRMGDCALHGLDHVAMRADLSYYARLRGPRIELGPSR